MTQNRLLSICTSLLGYIKNPSKTRKFWRSTGSMLRKTEEGFSPTRANLASTKSSPWR